ncbi:malto-oligosyltrehalose trehalohydrolase [Lapillicoccus jejuensis]|uniref:Malto-oligosyltrehalose trehalohydrolase n=1 Tax=Lapillicoccus jejuensis TaxID=402171 RepID=A0A542E2U9_9MICO|nr:malto-oligosyltrehalose trehalohydrolase [Lapillicoccus jejuensis]TQJ09653.1 maltooligosyl trehalose hydrolase [Lapillicoccus jejuensis]
MSGEGTRQTEIRVWAPAAQRVDLDVAPVGGVVTTTPMTHAPGGWWVWRGEGRTPLDYAFRLDGGDPRPDPRSAWQPHGVHGPSRTFDASSYGWGDDGWRGPREGAGALGGVFYELHVGTFTPEGTFDAALRRLDHLVALGVDVVEVMPVAAFPGRWGWGYDGVGLYAVHDAYGGPEAFQRFVDACHARGLGVCLDVVYNHLGPSGNYLGDFGPYFTDKHTTPWGPAVNLDDTGSDVVRRFVVDNALRWLRDFHVDALRLDAVHELRDSSSRHVLAQLSDEVAALSDELGRPLTLVAESDLNDPVMVTPTADGGRGMSAQWADDVHHALHAALTGESSGYYADFAEPGVLAKTLREVFLHDGRFSSFRGKEWGAKVDPQRHGGHRFVGYLQTHDQVGNRAVGDRVSDSLTPGQQATGAALYLLSAFTPMVFMGEEWAASTPWQFFTDFEEPELADAVREGRRGEFASHGWDAEEVPDPQDPATRERSVLRWDEVTEAGHARMLRWYTSLVDLRRSDPDLADDRLDHVHVHEEASRWLRLHRGGVRVVVNAVADPQVVPLDADDDERARVVLTWDPATTRRVPGGVELGGHGVAVLRVP